MILSDQDIVYIFVAVVDQDVEYYMRESCLTRLSKRELHKTLRKHPGLVSLRTLHNCVTQLKLDTVEKLSSPIFCCLSVCQASVSPDQMSTFSNIYRHTSPLLTQYNI